MSLHQTWSCPATPTLEPMAELEARLIVIRDQLVAAETRVALLAEMGLMRTQGNATALAFYEEKQAALIDIKTRLGVRNNGRHSI